MGGRTSSPPERRRTMKRLFLSLILFLALAVSLSVSISACGGSDGEQADDTDKGTFGKSGGVLTVDGGQLTIPPGALAEETEITLSVFSSGAPDVYGRVRVTRTFRISPTSLRFLSFATLSVRYLPENLPGDVYASMFDLRRSDASGAQERLNGVRVDAESETVSGEVLRGGTFWGTVPEAVRPASITLTAERQTLNVGETAALTFEVFDQAGAPMDPAAAKIVFSPQDGAVISVSEEGVVTALSPGRTSVTARAGAAAASLDIFVRNGAPLPSDLAWENPLPQGNSITALAFGSDAEKLYFAATDGSIWERNRSGNFRMRHRIEGARFGAIATSGGRLVAVGAIASAGLIVTLSEDSTDDAAESAVLPGSPLTALSFDGSAGIAAGPGPQLLLYNSVSGLWEPAESPSFDALSAVGFADGIPRVLTAGGKIYERLGEGWMLVSAVNPPEAVASAAPWNNGGFSAIDGQGAFVRIGKSGIWRTHALDETGGPDDGEPAEAASQLRPLSVTAAGGCTLVRAVSNENENSDGNTPLTSVFADCDSSLDDDTGGTPVWTRIGLPDAETPVLTARSETDLAAAGTAGRLLHWNGSAWSALSEGSRSWIIGLSAFDGGELFALTEECLNAACDMVSNRLLFRTAAGIFKDLTPPDGFAGRMHAVGGLRSRDIWVVGEGGRAYRLLEGDWSAADVTAFGALRGLEKCGEELWAVGDNGTVARTADGLWTRVTQTSGNLKALSCSGSNIMAVGDYLTVLWKNGSPVVITPNDNSIRTALWRAVYAAPGGEAFIGGNARYILFWDGVRFSHFDMPARLSVFNVRALAGTSVTDVWAAGTLTSGAGFLIHFDGADWTSFDPKTTRPILSLALSPDDGSLWVGGGNGSILRGTLPSP